MQALEQAGEIAGGIVGRLVVVDDLPEQLDFLRAGGDGVACLRQDVGNRPHPLVPARIRHHAEGAELVAAFDDGDVGLDWILAPGDPQGERHVAERIQVDHRSTPRGGVERLLDEHRQAFQILRTDNHVDGLGASQNLRTFLLRDAAGHRDERPVPGLELHLVEFAESRKELLLRLLPHAARVDQHHVRIAIIRRRLVAGLVEETGHALRVVDVHLTAVRLDEVFPGHSGTFASVPRGTFAFALSPYIRVLTGRAASAFRAHSP